jgi:branched-chain amino acid transport system permease protein
MNRADRPQPSASSWRELAQPIPPVPPPHQATIKEGRGGGVQSFLFYLVAAAVLAAAPAVLPPFAMTLLTEMLILGLLAMSLDLMVGYTRLISFGHAAAYGIGAYTAGDILLHTSVPLPFAVILAALVAGVIAVGVAWVCTLAKGVSFSMLTLAFAQLLYAVAFKWTAVTGASDGLAGIPRTAGPFGLTLFQTRDGYYYLVLACLIAAFAFCWSLVRSPFGAVLRGVRENEAKTLSLGYNTRRYKIAIVAIAYALGGLAGALYSPFAGFANTDLLFWLFSGQVLIMVIVGGQGTLVGPILGAAFFMLLEHVLSAYTDSWALFFGLIFIGFVMFAPEGIWGLLTWRKARA